MKFSIKIIIFLMFSFIFYLVAGEFVVRYAGWQDEMRIYKKVPVPDIDYVYVHKPNFEGWIFGAFVKTNSKGLRDKEYPYEKPKSTFRILAIGECSTFGHSVSLQDTWAKKLERILNEKVPFKDFSRYEVINGGSSQQRDLQKVAFLKEYGLKYNPDLIIFTHDISYRPWIDLNQKMKKMADIEKVIPKNILFLRLIYRGIEHKLQEYYLKRLSPDRAARYVDGSEFLIQADQALRQLAVLRRNEEIPILIMLNTDFVETDPSTKNGLLFKKVNHFFFTRCKEYNLPFLDLYEKVYVNEKPDIFWVRQDIPRPNRYAYQRIAEEIYKYFIINPPIVVR